MDLQKVIFVGGPSKRISVRMRCVQIAEMLHCDYVTEVEHIDQIPLTKTIFVCIKPGFPYEHLAVLRNRGIVVWDIHDFDPPQVHVDYYIASSQGAVNEYPKAKPITIIPHHHCNLSGVPNSDDDSRTIGWIGRPYWKPEIAGVEFRVYNSNIMSFSEVVQAYREMRIGLNIRRMNDGADFHARINGGGKLINCMGFGIPSVSCDEPAYHEYGEGCTVFADGQSVADVVEHLVSDRALYRRIRDRAFDAGRKFHIANIAQLYKRLLAELCIYQEV